MQAPIPFKIQLLDGKIVLSGDLDRSPAVRQECERIAKAALLQSDHWVVDAGQARLPPGGEETWSEIAHQLLDKCHLVYFPSQLAQNLEYDDEYRHGHSTFLETDDIAGREESDRGVQLPSQVAGRLDVASQGQQETGAHTDPPQARPTSAVPDPAISLKPRRSKLPTTRAAARGVQPTTAAGGAIESAQERREPFKQFTSQGKLFNLFDDVEARVFVAAPTDATHLQVGSVDRFQLVESEQVGMKLVKGITRPHLRKRIEAGEQVGFVTPNPNPKHE